MLVAQLRHPLLAARRLATRCPTAHFTRSSTIQSSSHARLAPELRTSLAPPVKSLTSPLFLNRPGVRLGVSLLLASAGYSAWALRSPTLCQSLPPEQPKALEAQPGGVASALGVLGGVVSMSAMVVLWVTAIAMPIVLIAALLTSRWRLAAVLCALYALPHVAPPPQLPLLRRPLLAGLKRWLGPPGTCRFEDISVKGIPEPEPEPSPKGSPQLFCVHPHGIYSVGVLLLLENKPEIRMLTSPFLYHFAPIFRTVGESLLGLKLGSVARNDLERHMRARESPLALVPGGFHEATLSNPGSERVYLENRRGFVKYALRHGYDLVPVYTFGEEDLMYNAQGAWKFRFFFNDLSLPMVLPYGHWLLPLFPRRGIPLKTVVGPAVSMPHIEKPTNEDVAKHHARYVQALQELYTRAAPGTSSEGRPLEIW